MGNASAKWDRTPTPVNDHDSCSQAEGVAILYGIFDPRANRGSLFVGVSHETSAFAVSSIRAWWLREGQGRYSNSKRLLILADTGGSNSATRGAWKDQLQQFCDCTGLTITVAHYPTGASKYFLGNTFRYDRGLKGRARKYLNMFPSNQAV